MRDHVDTIIQQWKEQRPELDASAIGVFGRLYRYQSIMEKTLLALYKEYGINMGEFDVLATLRRNGAPFELTPTELMSSMMLSSGAMTNRLDKLEKAGLIERKHSSEDRRSVRVLLCESGLGIINELMPLHLQREQGLLVGLSDDEVEQLALLLKKALHGVENQSS